MMQKDSTLQFWNDFYHDTDKPCEWIVQPDRTLFQLLCERLQKQYHQDKDSIATTIHNNNDQDTSHHRHHHFRILELGCGTSTLSRDFLAYLQEDEASKFFENVSIWATDVSPLCIQQNQARDGHIPQLHYAVLNAAIAYSPQDSKQSSDSAEDVLSQQPFDFIFDKGTLDTLLFRSRSRGGSEEIPEIVAQYLQNIHAWLQPTSGVYASITPRSKIKAYRDFPGFRTVERISCRNIPLGTLEGDKKKKDAQSWIHWGRRDDCFDPTLFELQRQQVAQLDEVPADDAICERCLLCFRDFRRGQHVEHKKAKAWNREWTGHLRHCQGSQ